jgi:hypothetical protein
MVAGAVLTEFQTGLFDLTSQPRPGCQVSLAQGRAVDPGLPISLSASKSARKRFSLILREFQLCSIILSSRYKEL